MPMVEQTVSGRTLQQFAPAPDNQTSVRDTDGDYTMEDDMFNLPTDGTDGRVVRGTRCGSQATMGCGNGTAPSPDASLLGINLEEQTSSVKSNQFPLAVTIVLLLVPVLAVALLLTLCYGFTQYRRHRGTIRRQQAESAALAFLAAMEARGTPMPASQPVPVAPSGVPCLCVQPDKHLALAMHEIPLLSEAVDTEAPPGSGVASTLVSVDLRNDVILEDHERHTAPHLSDAHYRSSFDGSNSQLTAIPSGVSALGAHAHLNIDTPTECSVELAVHATHSTSAAAAARSTVMGSPVLPMGSPVPTSVSGGSGRYLSQPPLTPDASQEHVDTVSLHQSARHRNPYAFMLDRGLQDPAHWSGDVIASRGSVRGLLNLGATLLSSRANVPHWQQDALEWAAIEMPVYRACITPDVAKWLAGRGQSGPGGGLTAGLLAVLTGGVRPSSMRSSPGMHLESAQSIASRARSHSGVQRVAMPSSVERRALSLGAVAGRSAWRLNGPPSWSAATATGSPVLLSSGSLRSSSVAGPGSTYSRTNGRPTSEENRRAHLFHTQSDVVGTGLPMSGPSAIAPASFMTGNKVLRMSDLGEYAGGDEQEHIASGQWVPPPPVVARTGLHCGMEVPWAELSLLPPEGMVPVSVVASGAFSQPWLHNHSVEHALGGCSAIHTSQGRSLCGMATVFESPGSGSDHMDDTLESLRGRSDRTTNSNGSRNSASAGADAEAGEREGEASNVNNKTDAHTKFVPAGESEAEKKLVDNGIAHVVHGRMCSDSDSEIAAAVQPAVCDHSTPDMHSTQHEECTAADGSGDSQADSREMLQDDNWNTVICEAEVKPPHASRTGAVSLAAQATTDIRNQDQIVLDTEDSGLRNRNCNDVGSCGLDAIGIDALPWEEESVCIHQPFITAEGELLLDLAGVVGRSAAVDDSLHTDIGRGEAPLLSE